MLSRYAGKFAESPKQHCQAANKRQQAESNICRQ